MKSFIAKPAEVESPAPAPMRTESAFCKIDLMFSILHLYRLKTTGLEKALYLVVIYRLQLKVI